MVIGGKPRLSLCQQQLLARPCTSRSNDAWLRVVNSPPPRWPDLARRRCKGQALSFPLLRESGTFSSSLISPATRRTVLQETVLLVMAIYICGTQKHTSWVSVSRSAGENN